MPDARKDDKSSGASRLPVRPNNASEIVHHTAAHSHEPAYPDGSAIARPFRVSLAWGWPRRWGEIIANGLFYGSGCVRALVIVLAILAGLKIWTQDHLYRSAVEEALLAAYRLPAQAACQAQPATGPTGLPLTVRNLDWSKHDEAQILIGDTNVTVPIWHFDDPNWKSRYKQAIIRLTLGDRLSRVACDYNVDSASARVHML